MVEQKNPINLSTIIPTIGREKLNRAVTSLLQQGFTGAFEVIVVNDSGRPLPPSEWQSDPRVVLLKTNLQERAAARNAGANAARGAYLHFLDDDDWVEPGGLQRLYDSSLDDHAKVLYGATRLIDREGRHLFDLEHELSGNIACPLMCGEWIPLQSSLIEKELFFDLGGFHPWQAGAEDVDFMRRAAVKTDFVYIPQSISCVEMGAVGSTTDKVAARQRSRRGREIILDQKDTFSRMRNSATAPRWFGGIVRIYMTSVIWNISNLRLLKSVKRGFYGAAALLRSGSCLLKSSFWEAVFKPYRSVTFQQAMESSLKDID